jgi:hypothetical protein
MIAPPRPPQDELEALIKEARERQLRRRLLGAAGIAIVSAIGLGVYAITIGGGSPTRPTDGSASGGPPLCRSAQLSGFAEFNGAAGSILGPVMISDRSPSACSLPSGRPVVRISSAGKRPRIVESRQSLSPKLAPRLRRGAMAEVFVQWFNWCGRPPTAITLVFGEGLRVTAHLTKTQPPCGDPALPSGLAVSRPLPPS